MVNKKSKFITALLYIPLFITPFVWDMNVMYSVLTAKTFYFYAFSFILFSVVLLYLLSSKILYNKKLNNLDIAIIIYVFYLFIRLLYTEYSSLYNGQFIIQTTLVAHYFILKNVFKKDVAKFIIAMAILASGIGQALYGLMQLYNFNPGYPTYYFKVVGTIGNPNSYAGFLISLWPFALGLYLFLDPANKLDKFLKYFALIVTGAILLILPATNTRGAWVAGLAGFLFIIIHKYNIVIKIKKVINTKSKAILAALTVAILLGGLFGGLYKLKPDSAFGRLFIWKITANMIKDKPVFGIGYNRYIVEYNNYQADYFAKNKGGEYEIKVADNNKQAHNDYLQITAEAGFIGLIFFLLIVLFIFNPESINKGNAVWIIAAQASLIAILVFALFSYPMRFIVTNINFYVFLAFVSAGIDKNVLPSLKTKI